MLLRPLGLAGLLALLTALPLRPAAAQAPPSTAPVVTAAVEVHGTLHELGPGRGVAARVEVGPLMAAAVWADYAQDRLLDWDRPSVHGTERSLLVGLALRVPRGTVSLAAGPSHLSGMRKGPLVSEGFLSDTYEEDPIDALGLGLELRLVGHRLPFAGVGTRFHAFLADGYAAGGVGVFIALGKLE